MGRYFIYKKSEVLKFPTTNDITDKLVALSILFGGSLNIQSKITIDNFLKYISFLNPQFIVCPFELLPPDCGKKRVVRCYKKIKNIF